VDDPKAVYVGISGVLLDEDTNGSTPSDRDEAETNNNVEH
jgi:hypothetical protein